MAFDKEEMKQLESLFNKFEEKIDKEFDQKLFSLDGKIDQKFMSFEEKMDQKFSVQRFEIMGDTKSVIDEKLKPIHEKLDRFFEMESDDTSELYTEMEKLQKRVKKMEMELTTFKR